MAKSSGGQRQKARQRKATRRRKRQASRSAPKRTVPSGRALFRTCGSWPLDECLLSRGWQEPGALTQILVSRRSPDGQIAAGSFLVDLGCLGVKNAFASLPETNEDYKVLHDRVAATQELMSADIDLVAKIVREAIAYAAELGFRPHRDYRDARYVLGDANPDACETEIPLGGGDGRPLFIAGPYDKAQQIIARLTRKLGPDGFHYTVPIEDIADSIDVGTIEIIDEQASNGETEETGEET